MRYSSILFVAPPLSSELYGARREYPPIGIGCLCEYLARNGIRCCSVDMSLHPLHRLLRVIEEESPEVIGISAMTLGYLRTYALVRQIKERWPEKSVILGGPHANLFRENVLQECPELDAIFLGEGEESLLAWMKGESPANIAGIGYRTSSGIKINEPEPLEDIDRYPFPRYERNEIGEYLPGRAIGIISSRGCPFACAYCESRSVLGARWRGRSVSNLLQEIRYWRAKGVRHISFVDDNFTMDTERIRALCHEIVKQRLNDIEYRAGGVRADRRTREVLSALRAANFTGLAFGIESGSDRVLQLMRKHVTVAEMDETVAEAMRLGFRIKFYLIAGFPGETWEDFEKTVAFVRRHRPALATFHMLLPIPGTEAFRRIEREGRLFHPPSEYLNYTHDVMDRPVFEAPGMSTAQRIAAIRLGRQIELITSLSYRARTRLSRFGRIGQLLGKTGWLGICAGLPRNWRAFRLLLSLLRGRHLCKGFLNPEHYDMSDSARPAD